MGELANTATDIVGGLRVLRGIGGEQVFLDRYRRQSQRARVSGVTVARLQSVLDALQVFLPGVFVVLVVWLVLIPFLKWVTSTYTVTDRRIITRRGILNKTGHDLPLRRINNVNYERSLTDRILGCGTLVLETAAGQPLVLHDLPRVERVHVLINNLLFRRGEDHLEGGEPSHWDD